MVSGRATITFRKITRWILVLLVAVPFCSYGQGWVISGRIFDESSKKGIPNVTVLARASKASTVSDSIGNFVIRLKSGNQQINISSVGYFPKIVNVTYQSTKAVLEVTLNPEIRQLNEVNIKEIAPDDNVQASQMGISRLNIKELKNIPVVFGEMDIIKALAMQPGVSTVGEGTAGFNVRGGRVDQNLVLLDGAPLFNTSHLLGFLSNINADVVQDVTLYKGDIPASNGGRLSSLLDINTRSGNRERLRFSTSVGLMAASATVDGPLTKDKRLTFLVAGRVAYPNFLIKTFPEPTNQNRAFFYDLNGRISYAISSRSRISGTIYHSQDKFKFPEDTLYGWQSTNVTFAWNHQINEKLSLELGAFSSRYQFNLNGISRTNEFDFSSGISQYSTQFKTLWQPTLHHKLEAGLSLTNYRLSPGNLSPVNGSNINKIDLEAEQALEEAIFVSDEWTPTSWFALNLGIRYVNFVNRGPGTTFVYNPSQPQSPETILDTLSFGKGQKIARFGGFEPRLSARFKISPSTSFKASYTKTRQYLHLISNTTAISPVDFWKMADNFVPPQVAEQYSAGIFRNFSDNTYATSVEIYKKNQRNLVEYKNGATLLLNPTLESDLLSALGKSYGVELSVQKLKGNVTGIISYTYSRSFVKVDPEFVQDRINRGEWYPSTIDQPHHLAMSGQWKWRNGWTLGSNFIFTTGRPITYPDGTYRLNDVIVQDYSLRNKDRIPNYHRLDIAFTKDTRKKADQTKYSLWSFSIYNVYARKNPYSIYFKQYGTRLVSYRLSVFGTLIPSISWKFNF